MQMVKSLYTGFRLTCYFYDTSYCDLYLQYYETIFKI